MPRKSMPRKSPPFISISTVLVLLTVWLISGCVTPQPPLPPEPVRSVQLPPLPTFARQPETPSECLPTCLDGLTKERAYWQTLLTGEASPAAPASASTTRPGKN